MIRLSVGLEHIDDIIHDFEQSFAASSAAQLDAKWKADRDATLGGAT
jgi:O-acetylhomoserine/O-acetylserine sulfhydrylase